MKDEKNKMLLALIHPSAFRLHPFFTVAWAVADLRRVPLNGLFLMERRHLDGNERASVQKRFDYIQI